MKEFRRKRILITGGAGFLGSHLCQQLLEQNHDVICIDTLSCCFLLLVYLE